jgi:hypothetical protein
MWANSLKSGFRTREIRQTLPVFAVEKSKRIGSLSERQTGEKPIDRQAHMSHSQNRARKTPYALGIHLDVKSAIVEVTDLVSPLNSRFRA